MAVAPPPRLGPSSASPAAEHPLARPRRSTVPPRPPGQRPKIAGPIVLAALLSLAVITGSLAGLTLVYSVDLPQMNDLENYRPSTTTELYDVKGRVIGSFALERREIVGYDDFAPILRQAVISIEDKSFESHWGINVFRVIGAVWYDIKTKGRACPEPSNSSPCSSRLGNLFSSPTFQRTPQQQNPGGSTSPSRSECDLHQGSRSLPFYGNQIYSRPRHARL